VEPASRGRLESINVSQGGVPKHPTPEADVRTEGVEGDLQRDLRYHGGPDRAVSVFSAERIAALQAEGHPIAPGTIGENLTVSGIDWTRANPGACLDIGAVRLEITGYAAPCANIAGSFAGGDIARVAQKTNPGWSRVYTRVLVPGHVRIGDSVVLFDAAGFQGSPTAEHGGAA
jgi:MOSC domain-containing protein YiiM